MSDQELSLRPQVELSNEQQRAFDAIVAFASDARKLTFSLHGAAGCGKTTLLAALARDPRFESMAALCALTGKASSILRKKTGLRATTIHSWLYQLKEIKKDAKGRREMLWTNRHENDALANKVVLLDESAMVGARIMRDVLATGAIVIAFGDPAQLHPINEPSFFCRPDFELTEVHRQALESPIIRQAHRVRNGQQYEADTDDFRVVKRVFDPDILAADIMLTWTNRSRFNLNAQARALRGILSVEPQVGEPLMCLRNCARAGIYKGGIYKLVAPFNAGDRSITIDVDGETKTVHNIKFDTTERSKDDDTLSSSFNFAYAATVHSAAGSEWDNVLLFDDFWSANPEERSRWVYTGITRASQRITVVRSR